MALSQKVNSSPIHLIRPSGVEVYSEIADHASFINTLMEQGTIFLDDGLTWTCTVGPQPAIGDGLCYITYARIGTLINFDFIFHPGASTTFGGGGTYHWYFDDLEMFFPSLATGNPVGSGVALDASAAPTKVLTVQFNQSDPGGLEPRAGFGFYAEGGILTKIFPITWASGDYIFMGATIQLDPNH